MKTTLCKEQFLCPECGSQELEPNSLGEASKHGTGMRRGYLCAECHLEIPAQLAERWGDISVEDARKEWREVYRHLAKAEETQANS
jgi:transcription elongation factor Elf1